MNASLEDSVIILIFFFLTKATSPGRQVLETQISKTVTSLDQKSRFNWAE
jgi:autotransporter translocation and assembly factor TamB